MLGIPPSLVSNYNVRLTLAASASPASAPGLLRSGSLRAVARRVALAGAAVDRVAVRGATLVLAVAPPDAPGRILLDASGLSPDAGEAFAATVFAAAEAPRGRVIP